MKGIVVRTGGVVVLLAGAALALGFYGLRGGRSAEQPPARHEEPAPGDDPLRRVCEHDIPAYQCGECRYESGVVKVEADLFGEAGSGGAPLLRTERVAKREFAAVQIFTGEVGLNENAVAHISPRISGVIRSAEVDIGAEVRKGDLLFEIESVELGRAASDYEKSLALVELSRKNYEREKRLFERKISSEKDMIEAQMAYEQYKTEQKADGQKLRLLGLSEEAMGRLGGDAGPRVTGNLPARAPFGGTIIEKHAVIGELAEPGRDVVLLADLSSVWVWADVYEQALGPLLEKKKDGEIPVDVSVQAFPGRTFPGAINYVGAVMDPATRTVKVRAAVRNPERLLRPGMFCEIQVSSGTEESVLAVPKAAVLSDEGTDFVFRHWKEDYYLRQPVKTGREFRDAIEILDGLRPDDSIIADGAFLMKSDVLRSKMGAGCAD
jgi:cobalt-zinc-cadmium efflux system membrane fusion protein